jgi:replicative DNA helicase
MANMQEVIEMMLDDEELSKAFDDPVMFARIVLDVEPRWYQKQMMRNGNMKKIARMGRRTGKTFTMIMYMLWYAFGHPDSKQLVIGPRGIQVDTIFDELRKFIRNSPLLQASLERSVQSPQRIEFGNGAVILGLSAGSSTGGSGTNVRGQGADWIYMDETDFLREDDINAIIGVSLGDIGSTGLWCSSTPTGARELFYEWCVNSGTKYEVESQEDHTPVKVERGSEEANNWTQFHYPSWVNPTWDNEMEAELRSMFTEQGYIHEVEAKFGDETEGVFNKESIANSQQDYTYEQMRARSPHPNTVRVLGVDWDKRICPVSYRELLEPPKAA